MKVLVNQLKEGCILSKDVNSLSSKSLFPSKTVVTKQTIEILNAFLIHAVEVEGFLVNGVAFLPETKNENNNSELDSISFYEMYLKVVNEYKQLFMNWQAGIQVEIGKVRELIIPLLEKALLEPSEIMNLHQFSTKSDYLYHHSVAVGIIAAYLGKKLQYDQGDCNQLALAGLLSDCGMSKIDRKILYKKGPLNSSEFNEIKKHPVLSYKMIEKISLLKDSVKLAVFQHHERVDGSGYVLGISGEKLHPFGKVVAISDVYHAMCCDTNYRIKRAPLVVLEEVAQGSFGKFDMQLVQVLIQEVARLTIGTVVKLSNGQIGKVIFVDDKYPTRPMVEVNDSLIQLSNRKELYIEQIIG
ncbi:HD-GYP domain-containing protein [Litchfieldia alkalitelluris]|uniref:HD-GYP domain-containing protein n=1 Tax=Litchfieldia alkalitelluris TaxID=304268 RepID=UPI0009976ADB|nr:HD-GYP domain-containing protein [Litchfieldia alkalitelluris]